MKPIILRLDNSFIYLNPVLKLNYGQSNLTKKNFQLKSECLVHLKVEQISYNKESGTLKVKVVDYSPSHYSELFEQSPKFPIRRIEFEKMDWAKFSLLVYSYTLGRLEENFYNTNQLYLSTIKSEENEATKQKIKWGIEQLRIKGPNSFFQEPRTLEIENKQTVVKVKFEEATFHDGQISCTAKLKDFNITRELLIINQNLKKEFENIKPWFIKKIGKSFRVTVILKLVDRQIVDVVANSDDISRINDDMIENIRTQRVLMLVKTARKRDDNKSVFNNDEIFGILEENGKDSNVFNSSADNILEILMDNGLAKNVKQLEFLSKDKQSLNEKLRFTLKPHFGFLFKVETSSKQFFIWELLNSHATYVWEKEINDSNFYQFVEHEISFITENGREQYRRYYKNITEKNFKFHLIEHEGEDLTEDLRFDWWRSKIELTIANAN